MSIGTSCKRGLAWLLIASLANPWAAWGQVPPSNAGDFLIYTSAASGGAAEPNILLIIDTSDSMNIPEPWREYPGAYDSHVEYLWNDIGIIRNSEETSQHASRISTAAQPADPYSQYGFWAGATLADRQALWNAARVYANATEAGDPGPRTTWRNYSESSTPSIPSSWYYWLPAGTAETDARLRSLSFNRFRGARSVLGGTRGGIPFTASTDYSTNNACASSAGHLLPSTVFHPTVVARNAGKYLNDQWFRWENWLAMDAVNVAGYPGSQTVTGGYIHGYLDASLAPPASWSPIPASGPLRDNTASTGATSQGQPIRLQNVGSHAGWTDPKADLGGYDFQSHVNSLDGPTLQSLRGIYGYALIAGAAGALPAERFSAWRGNRDNLPAAPAFGRMTGTAAYFDVTSSPLTACNPATGPASATCINVATGGSSDHTVTKTRACVYGGGATETDATGFTRRRGGTCTQSGGITCSDPNPGVNPPQCGATGDAEGPGIPPNPAACAMVTNNDFFNLDYGPTGSTPATTPAGPSACAWAGRASVAVATCQWSGRQSTWVEGQGWYYHGGTCQENGSTQHCAMGGSTITINGVDTPNVFGPHANPGPLATHLTTSACSNTLPANTYWHGGTCQGGLRSVGAALGAAATMAAASSANCAISGVTNPRNIRGTNYANVVAGSATSGCNPLADNNQTCSARTGYGGSACDHPTIATACPNRTSTLTGGGTASTPRYYLVANRSSTTAHLVHDCKADDTASNAMRAAARTWNTAWNATVSTSSATAGYTSSPGQAIAADAAKNIDVYSTNYLNWKFGPKGPNGHPIGRKTRLQIAKDALTDLVAVTNGVRFGLLVFNKTGTDGFAQGGNIAYKMATMGPKNCSLASPTTSGSMTAGSNIVTLVANPGFGIGNSITVPGAGAAGGNLVASITSVTGNTLTLSASASLSVAGVTIVVPACSGSETASYANRAVLIDKINNLTAASRTPLTESLYEAYRYFRGEAPVFGTLATAAFAGGTITDGRDSTAVSGGNYVSPMLSSLDPTTGLPAACQKNFTLLMTDGGPEDDFSANAAIRALTYAGPGGQVSPDTQADAIQADTPSGQFESGGLPYGPIDLAGTGGGSGGYIWLDELAYFMAQSDMNASIAGRQPVVTYTIGFAGANTPVLQQAAARAGGNNYVADDAAQLSAALTAAVAAIREWNPTVASPSVPISALNRSESGEEVYLAFFGPANSQAWQGTVKKFKFGEGTTACGATGGGTPIDLCLVGKTVLSGTTVKNIEQVDVDPITLEETVVVNPAAVSYWNPSSLQDGSKPNMGGTGQRLLDSGTWNPSTRKVYTFITNPGGASEAVSGNAALAHAGNAVSEANTTLITKTRLGNAGMSDAQRATLANFIRGGNPGVAACSDASAATACTTWRSWPHHDVLHAKPAVVTYDPTPAVDPEDASLQVATAQYLYYLSNDGLLHAVNAATGIEAWSFLVEEALPNINDIMNNLAGQHLTLADGAPVAWVHDVNKNGTIEAADGDKVYLFFGLRRGGRAYYALDVTTPDAPQFLWKIDRRGGGAKLCTPGGCANAPDFDELGYTWSTPATGRLRAIAAANEPALIFGGGYDGNQDNLTPTAADSMGRAVYVINGATGALLKAFKNGAAGLGDMNFSIPSDVAALNVDLDGQGYLDRLYVGDMAANLWRFDVNNTSPGDWAAKKIAELSNPFTLPTTVPNRKILFPPAVVKQNYLGQRYDAVYVGTGDREHPLLTTGSDKMFMVKDPDTGLAASAGAAAGFPGAFVDITNVFTEADLEAAGIDASTWGGKSGWYLNLTAGEKVVSAPTVFSNILRFSTYTPLESVSACVPPGKSVLYGMSALYGGTVAGTHASGTAQARRQYTGFATRGFIPTGTVIVRGSKVYIVHVSDGRLLYKEIGTIGGAIKTYWYRESKR